MIFFIWFGAYFVTIKYLGWIILFVAANYYFSQQIISFTAVFLSYCFVIIFLTYLAITLIDIKFRRGLIIFRFTGLNQFFHIFPNTNFLSQISRVQTFFFNNVRIFQSFSYLIKHEKII